MLWELVRGEGGDLARVCLRSEEALLDGIYAVWCLWTPTPKSYLCRVRGVVTRLFSANFLLVFSMAHFSLPEEVLAVQDVSTYHIPNELSVQGADSHDIRVSLEGNGLFVRTSAPVYIEPLYFRGC